MNSVLFVVIAAFFRRPWRRNIPCVLCSLPRWPGASWRPLGVGDPTPSLGPKRRFVGCVLGCLKCWLLGWSNRDEVRWRNSIYFHWSTTLCFRKISIEEALATRDWEINELFFLMFPLDLNPGPQDAIVTRFQVSNPFKMFLTSSWWWQDEPASWGIHPMLPSNDSLNIWGDHPLGLRLVMLCHTSTQVGFVYSTIPFKGPIQIVRKTRSMDHHISGKAWLPNNYTSCTIVNFLGGNFSS